MSKLTEEFAINSVPSIQILKSVRSLTDTEVNLTFTQHHFIEKNTPVLLPASGQ